MTYSSAEKEFYQRHYKEALQAGGAESIEQTEKTYFSPGKRYHILTKELDSKASYGAAVEIGCYTGECLIYLDSRYSFKQLIGIDIAFPDNTQSYVGRVEFMQGNSNGKLPLADGSIDVYVAMMVIEHLFDPFHAFTEIKRVLAPNGVAFVNLPLVTSLKNRLRLLTGQLPVTSVPFRRWLVDREWDGNHLHYFSMDSIRQLARATGLQVKSVYGVGRYHTIKTIAPTFLASEISFTMKLA